MSDGQPLSARLRALAEPAGRQWAWLACIILIAWVVEFIGKAIGHPVSGVDFIAIFCLIECIGLDRSAKNTRDALKAIADEFEGIGR